MDFRLALLITGHDLKNRGTQKKTDTRLVSISGHVKKPGYYEVEVGKATIGEMIFHFAGGLREGRTLKAIIPGGSSAKVFKAGEKFKLKKKGPDGKIGRASCRERGESAG